MNARPTASAVLLWAALGITLAFLTIPVAAIFASASPSDLISALKDPAAVDALRLSLACSAVTLAIIVAVGTPAAWKLARTDFPGKRVATTLVELPLVLPPAVAGLGLLVAFGPLGLIGRELERAGVSPVLTTAGVIMALVFVSAPFYIRQAQAAFELLDQSIVEAARTLGAGELRTLARVAVPTAGPSLIAGAALAWGRALGEFGATLMFAGSLRGVTQTAPLAVYDLFSTNLVAAEAVAAVLVAASGSILLVSKLASRSRR
jgi:molybdate transport system permease protein